MEFDTKKEIRNNRKALKPDWDILRKIKSDRQLDLAGPILFKQPKVNDVVIELRSEFPSIKQKTLKDVINNRRSLRSYRDKPMTFEEVEYLIWETCRIENVKGTAVFRTIPTGGARNGMETYIFINNVKEMKKGLYQYVQDKHQLVLINNSDDIHNQINASLNQQLRGAAVVFYFSAVPYRSEYKYSFTAHKMLAMEAGHAGQNLSLAAEIVDCGACCLAAYHQDKCDKVLELDGEEEFTMYAITVGKK